MLDNMFHKTPSPLLSERSSVSDDRKQIVVNLYESGIGEEFIAMQLDLEIPEVIKILKDQNVYNG